MGVYGNLAEMLDNIDQHLFKEKIVSQFVQKNKDFTRIESEIIYQLSMKEIGEESAFTNLGMQVMKKIEMK